MTMARVEHLGDTVTLYLGDCREAMKSITEIG